MARKIQSLEPPKEVRPLGVRTAPEQSPLNTLFGKSADAMRITEIDIADIEENPHQARKHFDQASLDMLAASIEERGLLQPILVRRPVQGIDKFQLIAGERRLRAHKQIGRTKIFAVVTKRDDSEVLGLLENIQRSDLTTLELAEGISQLMTARECTQEDAARIVGMVREDVTALLGILKLPSTILEEYRAGYSDRIGRAALVELSRIKDPETVDKMWQEAKAGNLTTKQARETRKSANASAADASEGRGLRALGLSLKSFEKVVNTLNEHRALLQQEHRDRLLKLRAEIDILLDTSNV